MRDRLAVLNLADLAVTVVAEHNEADVGAFQWVNNERLVYLWRDKQAAASEQPWSAGLSGVNRDGSGIRVLPRYAAMLDQPGAQDSNAIYVTMRPLADPSTAELMRLDTVTGRWTRVEGPGDTRFWLLDARGKPRLATTLEKGVATIHYLDPANGKWRKLTAFDIFLSGKDGFNPLEFAPDGTLYGTTEQGDKTALAAFDFATGKVQADAKATAWFDPKMKAVQATVDALLPGTINMLDVALRAETPWIVVHSYSDQQPSVLRIFNSETGKLTTIGASLPKIVAERMATQEFVHYKARDGLSIPAWVTLPGGSKGKKLPLVVLVHGGPYLRGSEWAYRLAEISGSR